MQTLFHLMSAENVHHYYKETLKAGKGWSVEKAKEILRAWQRRFIEVSCTSCLLCGHRMKLITVAALVIT